MDDRTVRARTRDRRKAQIAEMLALAPDRLEPIAGGDLAKPAFGRLLREPGEKPRQGRAVAAMRRPRAVDLDRVLTRLGQEAWIGGAVDLRARSLKPIEDPGGGGRGIDLNLAAFGGERVECRSELPRGHDRHSVAEMAFEAGSELAP